MISSTTTDYGDLALLVKAAGWLASSAAALILSWRGRSKKWIPVQDELPQIATLGRLLTIGLLALLWFGSATDLTQGHWLVRIVIGSAVLTVVLFLVNNFALTNLIYQSRTPTGQSIKVLGGLWLKAEARASLSKDTVEGFLAGNAYNKDRVWTRPSQGFAKMLVYTTFIVFTASGSSVLAGGALLLLAARQPSVAEFSIAPLTLIAGQSAQMHWRVANASKVEIAPLGQVPAQGDQFINPDKSTIYTLTAENTYGSRGIQTSVLVSPPPPVAVQPAQSKNAKKPHPAPPKSTPTPSNVLTEAARDCDLIRGVVIRGAGWLQSETESDNLNIASCSLDIPREGRYALSIRYASADARPVRVTLNNTILQESALAASTGGWSDPNFLDLPMGEFTLSAGRNTIEFRSEHPFPHIQSISFKAL